MSKPYVYIIEFKELGKRYIGVRYAKGCDKEELLQPGGYFTSSKVVHELLSQGHIATIVEIIEFNTAEQAVAEEARLIKEGLDSPDNNLLNIYSPCDGKFHMNWYKRDEEYRKRHGEKVSAGKSPESVKRGAEKLRFIIASRTDAERNAIIEKYKATRVSWSDEYRMEVNKGNSENQKKRTPEQKLETLLKIEKSYTPEKRLAAGKKISETKQNWSEEKRQAVSSKIKESFANRTPEEQAEINRKVAETKAKYSPDKKREIRRKRDETIGDRQCEINAKISKTLTARYESGELDHLKDVMRIRASEVMKRKLTYFDIFTGQSGRCDVDDPLVMIRKFPIQMTFLKDAEMIRNMKRNMSLYLLSNDSYMPPIEIDRKHIVRESSIAVCRYHHSETGETNLFVYGYSYPDWELGKLVREGKFRKVRDKEQCPNCEEMFATGVAYARHVKACTSLGEDHNVKCPHCGIKTPKSKSRRLHFDNCPSITGVKAVRSNVGKKLDMKECPHCGFVGATNIVSRYHMDNCEVVTGKKRQNKHLVKVCPHCGKSGAAGLMTRYHFNNCKHKPKEGL